ncbi:MAG: riboflavin synthase [Patescibacteria group bacterium]
MFTGIITETSRIKGSKAVQSGLTITFQKPAGWDDLTLGESVATNGACLTVAAIRSDEYDCHLVAETLAKTSFGHELPAIVNLERSLSVGGRIGGHFVQGHVDGVGKIVKIDKVDGYRLYVTFMPESQKWVIYKGSVTINGVALTVAEVSAGMLAVALIPHTLEHTTLKDLKVGDLVNLEFDMIGKYIVNVMESRDTDAKSTTS